MIRATLLLSLLAVAACTKSQAELEPVDRAGLAAVLAEDARVSTLMGDVDRAAQKGDLSKAVSTLDAVVRPRLADEQRALDGLVPRTAWGRARRDDLARLVADRQAAVEPYRAALLSKSLEAQLPALENQAKIERRAIAIVAAVQPAR